MSVGPDGSMPIPPPCEVITVPTCTVGAVKLPAGDVVVLVFTLPNGRQYQFPLDAAGRKAVAAAVNVVPVFGSRDMPPGQ